MPITAGKELQQYVEINNQMKFQDKQNSQEKSQTHNMHHLFYRNFNELLSIMHKNTEIETSNLIRETAKNTYK